MTRRVIAVLIAVVFAAIGAGAVLLYVRSADERALEGQEAVTVLIADKAIPAGTTGAAMRDQKLVRQVRYPADSLPEGVLDAIGTAEETLVATADVPAGYPLLNSMLGTVVSRGSGIAMPPGMLAVPARLTTQSFSPPSLQPGARVVVTFTYSPRSADTPKDVSGGGLDRAPDATIISTTLFPDVEVIAVQREEPADGGDGPALQPSAEISNVLTVTLALSHKDTLRLATAVALGGVLNVALRNEASDVKVDDRVDNKGLLD